MEGFLDIEAVSNLAGYTIEAIQLLVENKQIPHNAWPSGKVIFATRDIELWIKTHKLKKTPAAAPPESWPEETAAAAKAPEEEDPAGPPAKPGSTEKKAKKAAAVARATKGHKK